MYMLLQVNVHMKEEKQFWERSTWEKGRGKEGDREERKKERCSSQNRKENVGD